MRVVGVLDRHRPAVVERVLDLRVDLLVGEVRQEREGALSDSHLWLLLPSTPIGRRRDDVGHVGGLVVEGDVLPDLERGVQLGAALGGLLEDVRALLVVVLALVAGLDHRLDGDAVGGRAGARCPSGGRSCRRRTAGRRPRRGSASSWCIWPAWMPPEATGMTPGIERPVLVEEDRRARVLRDVVDRAGCRRSPASWRDRPRACRRRCRRGCGRRRSGGTTWRSRGS